MSKKFDLLTCQSLRIHFFFQFQLLLHNSKDKEKDKDKDFLDPHVPQDPHGFFFGGSDHPEIGILKRFRTVLVSKNSTRIRYQAINNEAQYDMK